MHWMLLANGCLSNLAEEVSLLERTIEVPNFGRAIVSLSLGAQLVSTVLKSDMWC